MLDGSEIAERLAEVRGRIAAAAGRSGRNVAEVRLVLASKTQAPEAIAAAYEAGVRDFGENYVQEAVSKRAELTRFEDIRWHLIGHLQTNKVRAAAATFDIIQTLDSERLAAGLHRIRPAPAMPVLIEINIGDEPSKSGVRPSDVEALLEAVRAKVDVRGLMTIPPASNRPDHARHWFVRMRQLRDRLAESTGLALSELSMGMTDDFAIAIEEGATIVRVGRAVFGERAR
jgi:PLP dependent protein